MAQLEDLKVVIIHKLSVHSRNELVDKLVGRRSTWESNR